MRPNSLAPGPAPSPGRRFYRPESSGGSLQLTLLPFLAQGVHSRNRVSSANRFGVAMWAYIVVVVMLACPRASWMIWRSSLSGAAAE